MQDSSEDRFEEWYDKMPPVLVHWGLDQGPLELTSNWWFKRAKEEQPQMETFSGSYILGKLKLVVSTSG